MSIALRTVALIAALTLPRPLAAQVELSPLVGVHFQRSTQPERIIIFRQTQLLTGDAWQLTAPGSGRALGARVGVGLSPRFRLDAIVSYARNDSWRYQLLNSLVPLEDRLPDSSFYTGKLLVMPRVAIELVPIGSPYHVRAAMGLTFARHSGSGESNLNSTKSAGGNFGLQLMRTFGRIALTADGLMSLYTTTTSPVLFVQGDRKTHVDPLLFAGLTLRLGNIPCVGRSSGPSLAPHPTTC